MQEESEEFSAQQSSYFKQFKKLSQNIKSMFDKVRSNNKVNRNLN